MPLHLFTAALRTFLRDGGDLTDLLGVVESAVEQVADGGLDRSRPEALVATARRRLGCGISGRVVPEVLYTVRLEAQPAPLDDVRADMLISKIAGLTTWSPEAVLPVAVVVTGVPSEEVGRVIRPPFPDMLVRHESELPSTVSIHEVSVLAL